MNDSITTKQVIENLIQDPNNEQEYRILIARILYSTRWLIYDSKSQKIGESYNWFHYDYWYTLSEFLEDYSGRKWIRDK